MAHAFRSLALAPLMLAFVAAPALAQPARPAAPTKPIEIPPPPTVNDPMLAPVPPANRSVASWEQALQFLRARSTDLRIAYEEVRRAEAQSRTALAATLPSITATGVATHQFITNETVQIVGVSGTSPIYRPISTPVQNYATANTVAVQPLLALEAWHAIGTAHAGEDASRLSLEDVKRTLALNIANAIVGVVTAERIAELNRVGFRSALERLELALRKKALGASTGLDVVRAQQDVESARSSLVTGDESLRQARETLGLALGSADPWGVPPDINLNGVEASARATCAGAATLEERADIAAARGTTEIARRNVDDARLRFSPTVDLVSNFGMIGSSGDPSATYASSRHEAWTIGGVLTVPFYDGGARYGFVRENRALEDEAMQRLEAARRAASVEVTQARRAVLVAEQNRVVAERSRDLARETERLSRIAFQAGSGTSLDLIESGRRLREAEIQLALQEFGLVRARIAALLSLSRCRW